MATVAKQPSSSESGADSHWRIIGQGTVFRTELYPSGLPAWEVPYAQRYDVAGPGYDKVVAEVEFADRPNIDYADLGREFPVDLRALGRGSDGEFTTAVEGVTRNSFISDEEFILAVARTAVAIATLNDPTRYAVDLEILMN